MLMRTLKFLVLGLFFGFSAGAGTVDPESEVFVQKGKYVTVTLMMGNPVKIFVAGKQRATFDLDDLKLEAKSGHEELELSKSGEYYVVKKPAAGFDQSGIIEVRTKLKKTKKAENFKFNVNKP
jgi:hypothetical protein